MPFLSLGGDGVISVISNVIPKEIVDIKTAFDEGNIEKARSIHHKIWPLIKVLYLETNPIPVKAALNILGLIHLEYRLPMSGPTRETIKTLEKTLNGFDI